MCHGVSKSGSPIPSEITPLVTAIGPGATRQPISGLSQNPSLLSGQSSYRRVRAMRLPFALLKGRGFKLKDFRHHPAPLVRRTDAHLEFVVAAAAHDIGPQRIYQAWQNNHCVRKVNLDANFVPAPTSQRKQMLRPKPDSLRPTSDHGSIITSQSSRWG